VWNDQVSGPVFLFHTWGTVFAIRGRDPDFSDPRHSFSPLLFDLLIASGAALDRCPRHIF
jgi:hypothetical protein